MNVVSAKNQLIKPTDSLKTVDVKAVAVTTDNFETTAAVTLRQSGSLLNSLSGRSSHPALEHGAGQADNVDDSVAAPSTNSDAAVNAATASDSSGVEAAKAAMQKTLVDLASDPEKFHDVMKNAFGDNYDRAAAETIRQQVVNGDFSWMPDIEVVDDSELQDQSGTQSEGTAYGAYSKDTNTIYISRQLLSSDPDLAAQILTEEVGHALDASLNTSDAAGDEGDIFARLASGESISESDMANLKAENDSGTIVIDGKEVEVEYGLFSKIKDGVTGIVDSVKGAVKGVVDGVTGAISSVVDGVKGVVTGAWDAYTGLVKDVWDAHKKVFRKIAESKVFQAVLTVAQFVPIPAIQVAAKVINLAMAAYRVGQGIKNGSVAGVLAGVAGVAGGAGKLGGMLGASAGFVDGAAKIANGARVAGMAYGAAATRDFGAAVGLASQVFGVDSQVGKAFATAGHAHAAVQSFENKDYLGVFQSGKNVHSGIQLLRADSAPPSTQESAVLNTAEEPTTSANGLSSILNSIKGNEVFQAIQGHVSTIRDVVDLVKNGEHEKASQLFLGNYADDLGIGESTQATINQWAGVVDKVDNVRELVGMQDYSTAIDQAANLLGIPLSSNNQQRLSTVFAIRDSVLGDQYATASRHAATLSMQSGRSDLATTFLQLANLLDGKLPGLSVLNLQGNLNAA